MTIDTPLKRWLADNLPDERPERIPPVSWEVLRRLATGESMPTLARSVGLEPDQVHHRARYWARILGYTGAGV